MSRSQKEIEAVSAAGNGADAGSKPKWHLKDLRDPMRVFFMGEYMSRTLDVLDFYETLTLTVHFPFLGQRFFKPIVNLYGEQYHSGRATPLRDVIPLIHEAKSMAVSECGCRVRSGACNHSTRTCLKINTGAEVELTKGQLKSERITNDEAVRIVEQAYKDGLLLSVEWCVEPNTYCICCCCSCCCVSHKLRYERDIKSGIMSSEYLPRFDEKACSGCGRCEEVCPGKAISVSNGARTVNEDLCVGCGLCEYHCAAGAIELVEAREATAAKDNNWFHYLIVYISILLVLAPYFFVYMTIKRNHRERAREIEW
ncbi:MAG: 4Fe-4S binding protein [bacterium]